MADLLEIKSLIEDQGKAWDAFNTKNVLAADPDAYAFGAGGGVLNYLPQLPIVPTFALEWRF